MPGQRTRAPVEKGEHPTGFWSGLPNWGCRPLDFASCALAFALRPRYSLPAHPPHYPLPETPPVTEPVQPNAVTAQGWEATLDAPGLDPGHTLPHRALALDDTLAATDLDATADHDATTAPPLTEPASETLARLPHLSWEQAAEGAPAQRLQADSRADLQLISLLGEGGMGQVHRAHQRSLRRDIALKTVLDQVDRPATRAALVREALVMGRLDHPNIVPIHVLGVDAQGRPALVMKQVDGVTWQSLLRDPDSPLLAKLAQGQPLEFHLEVLRRVADAVEFAHGRGVLHRDIKPDNVLVGRYGEVYLTDWGVAHLLQDAAQGDPASAVVGTPAMMAPELATGDLQALGPRTDVFLLGATLHLVLTGQYRHSGTTLREVLAHAARPKPVVYPPSVPLPLAALANRATEADPQKRPASAAEFRHGLDEFLRHRGLTDLAQAAHNSLVQLQQVRAAGPQGDHPGYVRTVHRLAAEAQFGFQQLLKLDPHHGAALQGTQACLKELIHFELQLDHPKEARALAEELREPDAEIQQALAELEHRHALAAEHQRQLERQADLADPMRNLTARYVILGGLLVAVVTVSTQVWRQRGQLNLKILLTYGIGVAVVASLGALWARRRLAYGLTREILWLTVGACWMVALNRALAYTSGVTDLTQVLRTELLIFAAFSLTERRYGWPSWLATALAMAGAAALPWWPEHMVPIFSGTASLFVLLMMTGPQLVARKLVRARQAGNAPAGY